MLVEYSKSYISFKSGPNPHKNLIFSAKYFDLDVSASGDLLALDALPRRPLLILAGFLSAPLGFSLAGSDGLGLGLPLSLEIEAVVVGGGELRLPLKRLAPTVHLLLGHPLPIATPGEAAA